MNWLKKFKYRYCPDVKASTDQEVMRDDLNDVIKEVARLGYRVVELEVRLGNAEETIKILLKQGGD